MAYSSCVLAVILFAQTAAVVPPPPTPPPPTAPPPLLVSDASRLALQQASAYQQAVIDEQIAELEVTQARAALRPKIRSTSTVTFNKPLSRQSNDPSFIAQNAAREYQS